MKYKKTAASESSQVRSTWSYTQLKVFKSHSQCYLYKVVRGKHRSGEGTVKQSIDRLLDFVAIPKSNLVITMAFSHHLSKIPLAFYEYLSRILFFTLRVNQTFVSMDSESLVLQFSIV